MLHYNYHDSSLCLVACKPCYVTLSPSGTECHGIACPTPTVCGSSAVVTATAADATPSAIRRREFVTTVGMASRAPPAETAATGSLTATQSGGHAQNKEV
ncbi:hypothetical protein ElyMa_003040400 [Elysia marginata]|uniref:TNFR-Cys domain-containing protein n=1 Tax=Elysia marginata TaxID=1093978 RepID=A0AAV4IHU9_9GAST|nr:hypothetical protein ElyMa_003040400 [Elysia marginata]